jgi:hypothetical protein
MRYPRWLSGAATALLVAVSSTTPADAADLGVRAGVYTDAKEPFAGVELLLAVGNRVFLNPNAGPLADPDRAPAR